MYCSLLPSLKMSSSLDAPYMNFSNPVVFTIIGFITSTSFSDIKSGMIKSLSVLSVPMKVPAAIGAFQIEAIAAGIPVVQPKIGGFIEFIEETGGGILYEPNDAETLASALQSLLLNPDRAKKLIEQGQKVVFQKYSHTQVVEDLIRVYKSI